MSSFRPTWFLCGGWAVDAWLGRQTREHGDLDITVFHDDQRAIFEHLAGWRLVAHDTTGAAHDELWDGRPLGYLEPGTRNAPAHLHATHPDFDFKLEVLVNERSANEWLLSREPQASLPMDRSFRHSPAGLATAVPEILMFFKATAYRGVEGYPRPRDLADFLALVPLLPPEDLGWLRQSISALHPAHPWLPQVTE
jgi:hypothetical protein